MASRLSKRGEPHRLRLPPQHGRVAVVTGANTGIGFETASLLAAAGATTVLACRSDGRADAARHELLCRHPQAHVELLRLDLADLGQVAGAAAEARARFEQIHVCVNNAGLIVRQRSVTEQSFETTLGVNHLGHFAWTAHLLPAVLAADDSRIVAVSSLAHLQATMAWGDLMGERSFKPVAAYRRSKIANLLHASELHRRLTQSDVPGASTTTAVAAHPGIAASSFWKNSAGPRFQWAARIAEVGISVIFSGVAKGAEPIAYAATAPSVVGGQCYGPRVAQRWGAPDLVTTSAEARDDASAQRLWAISEELTGVSYPL